MKRIIFIHGRSTKPLKQNLKMLWYEAIAFGLGRDFGDSTVYKFSHINKDFVYYGDLSNAYLHKKTDAVIPDDIISRLISLDLLKKYKSSDFNKHVYNALPCKNAALEFFADALSSSVSLFNVGKQLIGSVAPDLLEYWNSEAYYGSDIRYRFTDTLVKCFEQETDDILIVSHSLGTIVAYDCLWKLSHYGEYRHRFSDKKVNLITLGSPLGDENVKRELKGKNSTGLRKYPHNINSWINISAEDDYVCHDNKLSNDFQDMIELGLIKNIEEISPIYNLTVRNGKSNPHSSIGYLISPEFIQLLERWLRV